MPRRYTQDDYDPGTLNLGMEDEDLDIVIPGSEDDETFAEDSDEVGVKSGELEEHRGAAEIDHPMGSVKLKHLEGAVRALLENLVQGDDVAELGETFKIVGDLLLNKSNGNGGNLVAEGDASIEGEATVGGAVRSWELVQVRNPDNEDASVTLSWMDDVPRLRIGGSGPGAAGRFQIQRPGNTVNFEVSDSGVVNIPRNNNGVLRLARGAGNRSIIPYAAETWMIIDGNPNVSLNYYTSNPLTIINRLGGRVGIGTANPSSTYMLHVNAGSSWPARFQNSSGYIDLGPANTGGAHIYTDRTRFYFNKRLQIVATGNNCELRAHQEVLLYLSSGGDGVWRGIVSNSLLEGMLVRANNYRESTPVRRGSVYAVQGKPQNTDAQRFRCRDYGNGAFRTRYLSGW